jgi:hypothetical protein
VKHTIATANQQATSNKPYNEDFRHLERELRESPELAVGRIIARKELGCSKKTS